MSGEELKPAAWRYERNGVVALHSCRKPLYLTPGMGEWTETPLYAHPLPEQPQEGVSVETAAAFADQISEQHRQRANNAEARIAAALSMMPEADNWQEYALNMRMALSPPSTETKESGE